MRAISRELARLKRAEMASAPEYQADVLQMETEFATAYWEAFKPPPHNAHQHQHPSET